MSCHRGDPLARRKEIAHHRLLTGRAAEQGLSDAPAVAEGRLRVGQLACRRCHVVGGAGNRLATALDRVAWQRDQGDLAKSIGQPVGNMPRFGLDPRQAEAVIAHLLKSADPALSEATYRVRFAAMGSKSDSVFEARCGGCHRALGPGGPLGKGSAGPNLSGLLTPFYPATARGAKPWARGELGEWLENPRTVRPGAAMRPVRLESRELERMAGELGADRPPGSSSCPKEKR